MIKIILPILLVASQSLFSQNLSWPEITRLNKPWTRWWWPGSIVNQPDLTSAMEKYSKAGLGGLELTVIYGVRGYEERFINYLSPEWMKMFTFTLKEADRLGLGIDLANASGWPFGGPWVEPSDAARNINYKIWSLEDGQKLSEKIDYIQKSLVRPVGQKPDISRLIDPIGKNKDLQIYALDQIRFEKSIPLYTLMAYGDSGKVINLTGRVTAAKDLDWIAPPGKWTLYGLFEGWHGKQVERAGPGGEGDVIDHFSGLAVSNYLKRFDEAFKGSDLTGLRGYFNDSYEVDDASGQADWTNALFYEFYIRRGYDLRGYLPALFQKDDPDKSARVLSDYRQTISDLILDKFTTGWTEWAHRQGRFTRDQAHGSPGNILDLYAAADIPETEGNEITRFKFASSAANVTGKRLVSGEVATWLGEHFTSTLGDVRKTADQYFLGGINHIFYHGTCFSPLDAHWPGFQFYAAVEFNPANSLWNDFPALNQYISRVQSFLQQGRADNDVLVYFPVFDRYASYGRGLLEHFDALGPVYDKTAFKSAVGLMLEKGYAFDYVSDLQIKNTEFGEGVLQTQGNIYRTLVVPSCKYIPIETFSHILRMADDGATIIVYGSLPENIAGWADLDPGQQIFNRMKSGLTFANTSVEGVSEARIGTGRIVSGSDLEKLLSFAGIRRESMTDNGLKFTRRETVAGINYFIVNTGDKPYAGFLPLTASGSSFALFDPVSGRSGMARVNTGKSGSAEVYLKLSPGESLIISSYRNRIRGEEYSFYDNASGPQPITGTWKVNFTEGGPALPASFELNNTRSWTESGSEDAKNFSGTARYSISFVRPSGKAEAYLLDLGKVCVSARIILNREELGVLIGPDFKIIIDKDKIKSYNTLEVMVSNLMANRIAYMDRNSIPWKIFYNTNFAARLRENTKNGIFDASSWTPRESGLIGPVTITPLKKAG